MTLSIEVPYSDWMMSCWKVSLQEINIHTSRIQLPLARDWKSVSYVSVWNETRCVMSNISDHIMLKLNTTLWINIMGCTVSSSSSGILEVSLKLAFHTVDKWNFTPYETVSFKRKNTPSFGKLQNTSDSHNNSDNLC